MSKLHQNIRALRDLKGWNQDTMAKLLEMSPKAYARLEQGKTDIQLSRLEQIAAVLEIEIGKLFDLDRATMFKHSIYHSHTSNYNQSVHFPNTVSNLEHELEKNRLLLEQKNKEIDYLKQQVCDLREMITFLKK